MNQSVAQSIERAWDTIAQTWLQGRKVLVVLGAGASVKSGVPRMSDIFCNLRERIETKLDSIEKLPIGHSDNQIERSDAEARLKPLITKLSALEKDRAPRSDASIALGTLQRAGERLQISAIDRALHDLWLDFTNAFIAGEIGKKLNEKIVPLSDLKPSKTHHMCAKWAADRLAYVISLNFDGLTFRALTQEMDKRKSGVGIVISQPSELERFFTGDGMGGPSGNAGLVPIIKVWGDVFHAVCKNPQCPQHDAKIPAFDLGKQPAVEESDPTTPKRDLCPVCKAPRQLQIFFTGYNEKEKTAEDLTRQLIRFVAPEIGCILTIGFSGLWDKSVVDFLCLLSADLQREDRNRRGLVSTGDSWSPAACWINVEPNARPPLHQEIAAHGITTAHLCHVSAFAEVFCEAIDTRRINALPSAGDGYDGETLDEKFWHKLVEGKTTDGGVVKPLPAIYDQFRNLNYLKQFGRLRQLGIKTCVSAVKELSLPGFDEKEHNRLRHSTGAAHLAVYWFRHLAKQAIANGLLAKENEEWLANTVLYSAFHHDIGHIPFSHLAEEVFSEVRWTLEDWGDPFRHDEPVLASCIKDFQQDIFRTTEAAVLIGGKSDALTGYRFRCWIESAIQGRSGRHWVDAILNSPLDADKMDYVFRDCHFLRQGIHLPITGKDQESWIQDFVDHTRLLPSGLIALVGPAGDKARDFLEERSWLYKRQYFDPGYRAIERLASAIILHWLLQHVPASVVADSELMKMRQGDVAIGDTSAIKGRHARDLLWREMKNLEPFSLGEPALLLKLTESLKNSMNCGLPPPTRLGEWADACGSVFKKAFKESPSTGSGGLLDYMVKQGGLSCSETVFVPFRKLEKVREVTRELETFRPFGSLFDIAVIPTALSYPSRRRLKKDVRGECFAVSHPDPNRWGRSTGKWIPLSDSSFGQRDKTRWVQVMAVSPWSNDPNVPHSMDRFRDMCRERGIDVLDVDPEQV